LASNQANVLTIQVINSANQANNSQFGIPFSTPVAPPTGTVTFSGLPSGTVPTSPVTLSPGVDRSTLAPVGIATVTIPATGTSSNYSVSFSYSGDGNYNTQSGTVTIPNQNIGGTASTTTASITGSISPATTVVLSGTVTGKAGSAAPSNGGGGVLIYASGYPLAQISVTAGSGDVSTFTTVLNSRTLVQGTNPITVQYLGDSTYAPSSFQVSPALSNPLSDFSMVPEATIVPVAAGSSATDTINLTSINGFAGTVTYTCTAAS
jgi:hypothetical protein